MIRSDFTALFCILVPLPFILGAPVDDVLKQQQQQMASGAYREEPYWTYYNQVESKHYAMRIAQDRDKRKSTKETTYYRIPPKSSFHCMSYLRAKHPSLIRSNNLHAWNVYCDERGPANKKMDSLAGDVFGLTKRFDSISGATFGTQKRNFDEIDRNGFGAFVKRTYDNRPGYYKRNFDEIDRTGFGAFVKRSA